MNGVLRFSAWAGWVAATLLSAGPAVCVAGDLPMRNDFELQSALEETVGELGLAGDAAAGHLAVAPVDW